MRGSDLESYAPDMVVAPSVVIKADVKFTRLLRVEGTIEGKVIAPRTACLVLCKTGIFKGNLCGLGTVYINGKVEGDITVERLALGPAAVVTGNISCRSIEMTGKAQILGQLNVSPNLILPNDNSTNQSHLIEDQQL